MDEHRSSNGTRRNGHLTRRAFVQLAAAGCASTLLADWAVAQKSSPPATQPIEEPGSEIVSQIHNAPQWAAGTKYSPGNRVVELSQKPARAYQCVVGGNSAAPAPSGARDSIKDGGGVVWKYLSEVDYTSLTGWLYDAPAWQAGTTYLYHDYVSFGTPRCAYRCGAAGPGPSAIAPSDTGQTYHEGARHGNPEAGSDGYLWEEMATIGYSSGKSRIPTEKFPDGPKAGGHMVVQVAKNYTALLWNDAEYVAGERGEKHPITMEAHKAWIGEFTPKGMLTDFRLKIAAAPGESFMDHPDAPLRYDPANGVAIRNPAGGVAAWGMSPGNAILLHDSYVAFDGLQIKSETGRALGDLAGFDNQITLSNCILESDATGDVGAAEFDCQSSMINCLLIASGKVGLVSKYPMLIESCTIVSRKPAPDSIGIYPGTPWNKFVDGMTLIKNSAIFGWTYAGGHGDHKYSPDWWNPKCAGNATDTANTTDHHAIVIKDIGPKTGIIVDPLPGTGNHFNVPFDKTTFVDPGSDWRMAPSSPLHAIGMSASRRGGGGA